MASKAARTDPVDITPPSRSSSAAIDGSEGFLPNGAVSDWVGCGWAGMAGAGSPG